MKSLKPNLSSLISQLQEAIETSRFRSLFCVNYNRQLIRDEFDRIEDEMRATWPIPVGNPDYRPQIHD